MTTAFLLYMITRLDAVATLFTLVAILSSIALVITFIVRLNTNTFPEEFYSKYSEYYSERNHLTETNTRLNCDKILSFWWICILAWIFAAATPTKKDAMFIAAGVGVVEAAKSETAQRLASKSVHVIESYLDGLAKKEK